MYAILEARDVDFRRVEVFDERHEVRCHVNDASRSDQKSLHGRCDERRIEKYDISAEVFTNGQTVRLPRRFVFVAFAPDRLFTNISIELQDPLRIVVEFAVRDARRDPQVSAFRERFGEVAHQREPSNRHAVARQLFEFPKNVREIRHDHPIAQMGPTCQGGWGSRVVTRSNVRAMSRCAQGTPLVNPCPTRTLTADTFPKRVQMYAESDDLADVTDNLFSHQDTDPSPRTTRPGMGSRFHVVSHFGT